MKWRLLGKGFVAGAFVLLLVAPAYSQGNGGGNGLIPLVCTLDSNAPGTQATLLDDGSGPYIHRQDNVQCKAWDIFGDEVSTLQLTAFRKKWGGGKQDSRRMDIVVRECVAPVFGPNCSDRSYLPESIFETGYIDGEDWDHAKMEYAHIAIYPYRDGSAVFVPGRVYQMALRIHAGGEDFVINLADRVVPGDNKQGVWCGDNPWETTTDVNVWVRDEDGDSLPDSYMVTTGTFNSDLDPTTLTPGPMRAAICASDGPLHLDCDGSGNPWCNYLGEVEVQFTLYMQNL